MEILKNTYRRGLWIALLIHMRLSMQKLGPPNLRQMCARKRYLETNDSSPPYSPSWLKTRATIAKKGMVENYIINLGLQRGQVCLCTSIIFEAIHARVLKKVKWSNGPWKFYNNFILVDAPSIEYGRKDRGYCGIKTYLYDNLSI